MKVFFSVGEPSGDLHASNLIRRFKSERPDIECVGFGGPKMQAAGCEVLFDLTSLAIMFFLDALKNIQKFRQLAADAEAYFDSNSVDAVVLIDYPGFNWWIAQRAKRRGIPVYYYGVPQMWAWAPWRIRKIRKYVDHVLCKLPFEVDWFAKRGCRATYVGHPYFDQLASQQYDEHFLDEHSLRVPEEGAEAATAELASERLLLLLPGSRNREVERNLPILVKAAAKTARQVPVRIAVACFNEVQYEMAQELCRDELAKGLALELYVDKTPELMRSATVCMACSGSVSLELLQHRKPTVIVYKLGLTIRVLQSFILRTRFITLVNLIAVDDIRKPGWWGTYDPDAPGAEPTVMPEYLTIGDPSEKMAKRAVGWLTDESARRGVVEWMDRLAIRYAKTGATERAADYILSTLEERPKKSADPTKTVKGSSSVSQTEAA